MTSTNKTQRSAGGFFSSEKSGAGTLAVDPPLDLFDRPMSIRAHGLAPGQRVTIVAYCTLSQAQFGSYGCFIANHKGEVDCSCDKPVYGTYDVPDPMGLIWSIRELQNPLARFWPNDSRRPVVIHFSLLDGFYVEPYQTGFNAPLITTADCTRLLKHPSVERITVRSSTGVRGALFLPQVMQESLPAIIDLYGGAGGLRESRAALLASHGFAVLALAYFKYEDLAETADGLRLDYFIRAIDFLCNHPRVNCDRVGFIGVSLGSTLAALVASRCPKVSAVVFLNGSHRLWGGFDCIDLDGTVVPKPIMETFLDNTMVNHTSDHQIEIADAISRAEPTSGWDEFTIPVERSNAHFLLVHSLDDRASPARFSAHKLSERLEAAGKSEQVHLFPLPEAGHIVEPPYYPHLFQERSQRIHSDGQHYKFVHGGRQHSHVTNQVRCWSATIGFFASYVGQPADLASLRGPHAKL